MQGSVAYLPRNDELEGNPTGDGGGGGGCGDDDDADAGRESEAGTRRLNARNAIVW